MQKPTTLLSHQADPNDLAPLSAALRERVRGSGDTPDATVDEQLAMIDALEGFPLGRFLLCHQGFDAAASHFAFVHYPQEGKASGLGEDGRPLTDFERRLLDTPVIRASQERFRFFQAALQPQVREGVHLGSVPCGTMDDLLTLDYGGVHGFTLWGLDLDPRALQLAARRAEQLGLSSHVSLQVSDAWALPLNDDLHVLTSNGLNVYEASDERILLLYRSFRHALKRGGLLVTSFLTPPGGADQQLDAFDAEELRFQRVLFGQVLRVTWNHYRSTATSRAQLEQAGFTVLDVMPGEGGIFPTIIARRN